MSIRLRIALFTATLMTVLLLLIGGGIYFTLQRSLNDEIDSRLARVARSLADESTIIRRDGVPVRVDLPTANPFVSRGLYIQVINNQGDVVAKSPEAIEGVLPVPESVITRNQQSQSVYFSTSFETVDVRVFSAALVESQSNLIVGTVQVAEPLAPLKNTLAKLRLFLLAGLGFGMIVSAFGAFILSGRSLRPLTRITTASKLIGGSGDLSDRINPPNTGDEVQELAETFNAMLGRLEDAFSAERRFVSDASHELRTPLTALRGNAEILLRQVDADDLDSSELTEVLTDIRDEAERMGRLVQNLLTLARADVGWRPDLEAIQLDVVASDAARVATPLARRHQFSVQIQDDIDVIGNADQLKQLVIILLDNAFTYTPEGGEVEMRVEGGKETAEISVRDSGPGIPQEQVERIFDRFYRGDAARNQRAAGAGLGLAIARWIVECHHGGITAESDRTAGTIVRVQIPLVPDTPPPDEQKPVKQVRETAVAGATASSRESLRA